MKDVDSDFISRLKRSCGILILGHRGCRNSDVPENTLPAFRKAFDAGADGIEIDVETTSDGRLVVVNRWFLNHHFGFFPWERSLADIQAKALEKGIAVPTFDAVCRLIEAIPCAIFNVEIKSSDRRICRTAIQAANCIRQYGISRRVIVSSFDTNTLLTLKFKHPEIDTAYLFRKEDRVTNLADKDSLAYKLNGMLNRSGIKALATGAATLHPEISLFQPRGKRLWQHYAALTQKRTNAWTVDTPQDFHKALDSGVDIIISDDPQKMIQYRSEYFRRR